MPKITLLPHETLCPEGLTIENATKGESICNLLLEANVPIEHACEQSCACATCHVHVREGYDSLNAPSEIEEDLLDQAWDLEEDSRLSCQALVGDEDLVVEIPKYSINHAKENH
ncbi:MAG: ISC system 2Fe-2S type ferredoxin [Neisseriaceae bacterium]